MKYGWYAYDLAVPLFYFMVIDDSGTVAATQDQWFYGSLVDGYKAENLITDEWLNRIPAFVRMRRIEMYAWAHRLLDVTTLSGRVERAFSRTRQALGNREPLL